MPKDDPQPQERSSPNGQESDEARRGEARRGAAQTMEAALAKAAELRAWRGPEAAP